MTPQQKAAYIADVFNDGAALTAVEVARMFGISKQGAYRLLDNVSGAIPLLLHEHKWRRLPRSQRGVDRDVLE